MISMWEVNLVARDVRAVGVGAVGGGLRVGALGRRLAIRVSSLTECGFLEVRIPLCEMCMKKTLELWPREI